MACVVHMVRKYSGCTVRTLLRVPNAASNANAAAAAEALKSEAQRTLTEARIDSVIEPVLLDAGELTPKSYELKVRDSPSRNGQTVLKARSMPTQSWPQSRYNTLYIVYMCLDFENKRPGGFQRFCR